jgi:hypothetical protein
LDILSQRPQFADIFQETTEKVIEIQDDTPDTIACVMSYLYIGDYDDGGNELRSRAPDPVPFNRPSVAASPEDKPGDAELMKQVALMNIRVFVTADKFGILPLKTLAMQKFSPWACLNWDSPIFPEIAEAVMAKVPAHEPGLRVILARTIAKHILELARKPAIMSLLNSFGSLSTLVIAGLIRDGRIQEERDPLEEFARRFHATRYCLECSAKLSVDPGNAEFHAKNFHCADCLARRR